MELWLPNCIFYMRSCCGLIFGLKVSEIHIMHCCRKYFLPIKNATYILIDKLAQRYISAHVLSYHDLELQIQKFNVYMSFPFIPESVAKMWYLILRTSVSHHYAHHLVYFCLDHISCIWQKCHNFDEIWNKMSQKKAWPHQFWNCKKLRKSFSWTHSLHVIRTPKHLYYKNKII